MRRQDRRPHERVDVAADASGAPAASSGSTRSPRALQPSLWSPAARRSATATSRAARARPSERPTSIASRTRSMFPSPPHWTSSAPPGTERPRRGVGHSRSWSVTQWKVAVETIASTGEGEIEIEHVLAPHLGAIAETRARQRHHVGRGIQREHTAPRHERQQRLGDPPGPAADVQDACVRSDPALDAREHLRPPCLLRLARRVSRFGRPTESASPHRATPGGRFTPCWEAARRRKGGGGDHPAIPRGISWRTTSHGA